MGLMPSDVWTSRGSEVCCSCAVHFSVYVEGAATSARVTRSTNFGPLWYLDRAAG